MSHLRPSWWPILCAGCLGLVLAIALGVYPGSSGASGASANIEPGEIRLFKVEGARWIREQRDRYRPEGRPLTEEERRLVGSFFSESVLDRARIVILDRFENPDFFSVFDEAGLPYPLDLTRASGLALVDTILVSPRSQGSKTLLFHELVHLAQYDFLGLEEYMEGYVDGWAEGGRSYRTIPHERQAFELASRFARGSEPFSVAEAVRAEFGL